MECEIFLISESEIPFNTGLSVESSVLVCHQQSNNENDNNDNKRVPTTTTTSSSSSSSCTPTNNNNVSYWERLSSNSLSFGSAETLTVGQPHALTFKSTDLERGMPSWDVVCMDCQRHQRNLNQYRAMFVMGINVDWQNRLIYNDVQQALIPKEFNVEEEVPNQVPLKSSAWKNLRPKPNNWKPQRNTLKLILNMLKY